MFLAPRKPKTSGGTGQAEDSGLGVFCTFWLRQRHVLRATTACNFSSLIWPDGSAPAALASILFDPPTRQIISRLFYLLPHLHLPATSFVCIFAYPPQMSHACHRFWKCYKTLTFCSLLKRCTIPCACHAKRHLNLQKWSEPLVFLTFWLRNVLRATTACTFLTSQLPKVVRGWGVLYILTLKCTSRHNSVHFFDISTSKSGPTLRCFVHFHFEMCFAPQRRAIFHLSSGQLAPHPPL